MDPYKNNLRRFLSKFIDIIPHLYLIFVIRRVLEIEINSVEEGPVKDTHAVIYVPVPAQIALSSMSSLLEIIIESSLDRQAAFNQTLSVITTDKSKYTAADSTAKCTSLIDRFIHIIEVTIGFVKLFL